MLSCVSCPRIYTGSTGSRGIPDLGLYAVAFRELRYLVRHGAHRAGGVAGLAETPDRILHGGRQLADRLEDHVDAGILLVDGVGDLTGRRGAAADDLRERSQVFARRLGL